MKVAGKVAIVTGAGGGIGGALTARLAQDGARIVAADLDAAAAQAVADGVNARHRGSVISVGADVSDSAAIAQLIARAEREFGPVDLYFANAGVVGGSGLDAGEPDWDRAIAVNLRAHVRAARLLVPAWIARGGGYFIATASAAGLLTQIGSATYTATKHAAVGFAEWLSITYGDEGVRVSCLCPMGVNTNMLHPRTRSGDPLDDLGKRAVEQAGKVLEPETVADVVLQAIDEERFLILPHPDVLEMYRHKGADYDRWLRGMRRYQRSLRAQGD
ncbi:MAG: SDR family oxidoreductase [Rhodanobacteraceae bacterium]